MSAEASLDSNILLYALSRSPEDAVKSAVAQRIMREVKFGVSLTALQEFYAVVCRRARLCIGREEAEQMIGQLLKRPVAGMSVELFARAREISVRYKIGYWDAAIVASAEEIGTPLLYSEDLSHGQTYGKIKVINPFADVP